MEIALILIISGLVGYLFGSIPNGYLIGKIFFKKDVREYGSKNTGGTNVGRVFGKKVGLVVILLDVLKTIIPMYSTFFILKYTSLNQYNVHDYGLMISSFMALVGHCFPIYTKFKGGKAVSSYLAICLATNWLFTLVGALFYFIILKWKKYVSLASITTSIFITILTFIYAFFDTSFGMILIHNSFYYFGFICLCTIILILRHMSNIKRLLNHSENKIKWLK